MSSRSLVPVAVWAILVLAVAAAAAAWLNVSGGSYRDLSPAVLLVAYSPAVIAIAVTAVADRGPGLRHLLGQLLRWRAAPGWYVLAVLGPFALALITTTILAVGTGNAPVQWIVFPDMTALLVLLGPLIAGSVGEELGWRGFGQARTQLRTGALVAAVAIGLLWSTWHLWIVLTPEGFVDVGAVDVTQTFVRLLSTAVVYAWLYNASGGSLPVVMVAHAAHNLAIETMPAQAIGTDAGALTMAGLYLLAALVVIGATRGRLGFSRRPRG
jgi:membrane protease YdiL (CAAX protease family)